MLSDELPDTALNRTVPLILAVALFMENMDSTVIATSLPAIATDIGTSPIALKLALAAYFVALAIFIPVSSWMADRYGAKQLFRLAIGVFIVGSVSCAISSSLAEFVLARFLQGMGGAMMSPIARLVLVRSTSKRDLVAAMSWLTVPGVIGPVFGPPVGGFITTYFSWHWIFLINVPIGLAGIVLTTIYLPEIARSPGKRIDLVGFVFAGFAAAGIVFGLSVISLPALPPIVGFVTLMVGLASSLAYLRHAGRHANPLLDFRLLDNAIFRITIIGGSLFRIGSGATPFLLPLLFQIGFGMSPFQSGLLSAASALGALAMKFLAPFTLRTGGFRNVLVWSSLLVAVVMVANGFFTPGTPYALIVAVLLASGFLRSLFFTAVNTLVFAELDEKDASQATAISASAQQVSVAVGVAVAGGILEMAAIATGQPLGPASFTAAFFLVSVIIVGAGVAFARLPADAGSAVSGHGPRGGRDGEPPSPV